MSQLIVLWRADIDDDTCAVCAGSLDGSSGMRLATAEGRQPVCPNCARKEAPALAALINLAQAAERIGKIGRHTVTPPLSALLELARAAESYSSATARAA